jgi:hypothetical protein
MAAPWCLFPCTRPRTACSRRGLSTTLYLAAPLTSRSRRDPGVRPCPATFVSVQLLFTRFDNIVHTFTSFLLPLDASLLCPADSLFTPLRPESRLPS